MNNLSERLIYNCSLDLQVFENGELIKSFNQENLVTNTGWSGLYENMVSKSSYSGKTYGPISWSLFGTSTIASDVTSTYSSYGASDGNYRYANAINGYSFNNAYLKINMKLDEQEFNIPAQLSPSLPVACIGLGFYKYTTVSEYIKPTHIFNRILLEEANRFYKTYNTKISGVWTITIAQ